MRIDPEQTTNEMRSASKGLVGNSAVTGGQSGRTMVIRRKKHGQSLIEFLALILFILAVFFAFQKYIVRGISGKWKEAGDTLGQGRIYDPRKTLECAYFATQPLLDDFGVFIPPPPDDPGFWYNRTCFEERCQKDKFFDAIPAPICSSPYDVGCTPSGAIGLPAIPGTECARTCQTPLCDD